MHYITLFWKINHWKWILCSYYMRIIRLHENSPILWILCIICEFSCNLMIKNIYILLLKLLMGGNLNSFNVWILCITDKFSCNLTIKNESFYYYNYNNGRGYKSMIHPNYMRNKKGGV